MKIAYDSQIFSGQIYGGVSRYICELATRISKNPELDVKVVAPMFVNAYLENLPKSILQGFHSPFPYEFMRLYQRAASMLLGDIMLQAIKPDIVHETYYFKYPLGPKRAVRILTIHDMIHEKFESQFQYGDKTSRHKALAAARADHVICVSESTKHDVIEILGISPEKISVIHLGFDLMAANNNAHDQMPPLMDKPYLLYVGNRGGYKNFQQMLEAYASSKLLKSEFKVICFGGGDFNTEELAIMHKLNISGDQVRQISGDDQLLAKLYQGARSFVFPSLYEGFGLPPLEAMSYGCPVVCSNKSSIPEVVGDAGQYFDPYDVNSIQTAIEEVVESNELSESLAKLGRNRLNTYSWDKCARDTLHIYKNII